MGNALQGLFASLADEKIITEIWGLTNSLPDYVWYDVKK